MRIRNGRQHRSGSVLVFAAFMMVVMFGLIAFAVDVGYLSVVRSQLQSSADAAALAAAWELVNEQDLTADAGSQEWYGVYQTINVAGQYADLNQVASSAPTLAPEDVVVGHVDDPFDLSAPWSFVDPSSFNAVRVSVRKTGSQNGEVGLFFAKALGFGSAAMEAEATAMFMNNIGGFAAPSSGENLGILPFTIDKQTMDALLVGVGEDNWTWNEADGTITPGPDGILEMNLFPEGAGSPGNRGTVDIGSNNNSTADISRQILGGISAADLEFHDGELVFDADGELPLNGDTGISAGVEDELISIMGEPKIVPLFSQLTGPGNNSTYTVVGFAGIRIMEVKLTGNLSDKRVIIQPAKVKMKGAIPAPPGSPQMSHFVYSPVWLVR